MEYSSSANQRAVQSTPTRDIMNLITTSRTYICMCVPVEPHTTSHLPERRRPEAFSFVMELRESPTYYPSDARLSKMSRYVARLRSVLIERPQPVQRSDYGLIRKFRS